MVVHGRNYLDALYKNFISTISSLNIIDPRSDLLNAKKKYPSNFLYHQLENHWNELGSFIAYQTLMKDFQKRFSGVAPLAISDIEIKSIPIKADVLGFEVENEKVLVRFKGN